MVTSFGERVARPCTPASWTHSLLRIVAQRSDGILRLPFTRWNRYLAEGYCVGCISLLWARVDSEKRAKELEKTVVSSFSASSCLLGQVSPITRSPKTGDHLVERNAFIVSQ